MISHISGDGKEQSVYDHTMGTIEIAIEEAKKICLGNLIYLITMFHDIGKLCYAFGEYIRQSVLYNNDKIKMITHSATGAHYFYYDLPDEFKASSLLKEMVSTVIASHHGAYDCVRLDGRHRSSSDDRWAVDENYEESICNFKELIEKDNYDEIIKRIEYANSELDEVNKIFHKLTDKKSEAFFYRGCLLRLLLSYQIYGDWKDTENFMNNSKEEQNYQMMEIWENCLANYELYMTKLLGKSNGSDKIKQYRQEISQECADAFEIKPGVYRLSVPTGGGKTLSSMSFALRHALRYEKDRIFYISPFLSILEQNADVIREVIGDDSLILEHHSQVADTDKDARCEEKEGSIAIDWDYPIVLTTLVQFMNTLFSDKLQCIRRMHWLANSVIIIDEVQALPVKCISTFNLMINFLAYVCNATVILCTATQPALGENKMKQNNVLEHKIIFNEQEEMIKNVEKRFVQFERTKVVSAIKDKNYTSEEVCDFVAEKCGEVDSMLVVLNTKSAVKTLYDNISNLIEDTYIYSLTTNMCPEHRSNVINEIKGVLKRIRNGSGERVLVISTSLIEAGVDLSFNSVIRALTGLDSIIQAAGRCNRHGEREYGEVYIINTEENTDSLIDTVNGAKAAKQIIDDLVQDNKLDELFMPNTIYNYYMSYYNKRYNEMNYPYKDINSITTLFSLLSENEKAVEECKKIYIQKGMRFKNKLNQAFKTAWSNYNVINDDTIGIIVP